MAGRSRLRSVSFWTWIAAAICGAGLVYLLGYCLALLIILWRM